MKRNLLTKTLLLATGLLVGASAWADKYEVLYGVPTYAADGVTITSVAAQTDFTGDANEKTDVTFSDSNGNSFTIGGSVLLANTSSAWTKNFSAPVSAGKVYFSGEYTHTANGTSYVFQIIGTADDEDYSIYKSMVTCGTSKGAAKNESDKVVAVILENEIKNYVRLSKDAGSKVNLCIDLDARTITYELFVSSGNKSGTTKTGSFDLPANLTNVKGLSVAQANQEVYLDNVLLYSQVSENPLYTINYKNGEDIVKTVSGREALGTVITADAAITGIDSKRYLITEDEAPTLTIASGENVLNVPVRATYKATLKVTTTIGNTPTENEIALEESDAKDCGWSYFYPLYTKSGDTFYKTDATTFGWTGTFTDGEVIEKSVSYPTADKDVIFFTEGTDCGYLVLSNTNNPAYSSGNTMTANTSANHGNARNRGVGVGNLDAGYYTMVANITKANKRALAIRINSGGYNDSNIPLASITGNSTGIQSTDFSLDATSAIVITGANSGGDTGAKSGHMEDFDYIIVKKVSVAPSVTDYATFSSNYPLDFSKATGVKAYYASASNGSTVTMKKVEGAVAAGTGLLLQKDGEGAVSIPTAATGDDLSATNLLKPGKGVAVVSEGTTKRYVLAGEGESTSFYNLATAVVIPEGKAYLEVTGAGSRLRIAFSDSETTGIQSVHSSQSIAHSYYNLNGQRVASPVKGLYIVNGKKIIKK